MTAEAMDLLLTRLHEAGKVLAPLLDMFRQQPPVGLSEQVAVMVAMLRAISAHVLPPTAICL